MSFEGAAGTTTRCDLPSQSQGPYSFDFVRRRSSPDLISPKQEHNVSFVRHERTNDMLSKCGLSTVLEAARQLLTTRPAIDSSYNGGAAAASTDECHNRDGAFSASYTLENAFDLAASKYDVTSASFHPCGGPEAYTVFASSPRFTARILEQQDEQEAVPTSHNDEGCGSAGGDKGKSKETAGASMYAVNSASCWPHLLVAQSQSPPDTAAAVASGQSPAMPPRRKSIAALSSNYYANYGAVQQRHSCSQSTIQGCATTWPPDAQIALYEALHVLPQLGHRRLTVCGKMSGRNGLIADYVRRKTGIVRTRKQVSSHIQELRKVHRDNKYFQNLLGVPKDGNTDYHTPAGGEIYADALKSYMADGVCDVAPSITTTVPFHQRVRS